MGKLEEEYERTAQAIPQARPHGRVNVAIDFSNQIYGFQGHKTNEPSIYDCDEYSIWSSVPSVATDRKKLHEKTDFYNTRDILVNYCNNPQTLLLEDEAYSWFMSASRTWQDFNSKDFLEQTFITHTIWRLQVHVTEVEPWKELLKEYHSEDARLLNRFLEILEPKISETAKYLFNSWNQLIDYNDIYLRAFILVGSLVFGDNKKIIGEVLDAYNRNQTDNKSSIKSLNRDFRLHPFSTHSNKNKSDIKKTFHENTNFLFELIKERSSDASPIVETLLQLLINPDDRSSWLTSSLNRNSERIYCPNGNISVAEFVFGRKKYSRSPLSRYLNDSFHTEKNQRKKVTQYADDAEKNRRLIVTQSDDGENEYFLEEIPHAPRRWKRNDVLRKYSLEELSQFKQKSESILKGKLLIAYKAFLDGRYYSTNRKMSKNLSRARKILREKAPDLPQ